MGAMVSKHHVVHSKFGFVMLNGWRLSCVSLWIELSENAVSAISCVFICFSFTVFGFDNSRICMISECHIIQAST